MKRCLRMTKGEAPFSTKLALLSEDGTKELGVIPFSAATWRIASEISPGGTLVLEIPGLFLEADVRQMIEECEVRIVQPSKEECLAQLQALGYAVQLINDPGDSKSSIRIGEAAPKQKFQLDSAFGREDLHISVADDGGVTHAAGTCDEPCSLFDPSKHEPPLMADESESES